ncbi:MAG: hypothetical protein VX519_11805 [Myxococcota bacterium]|nr:hypothetical protein [Myxococcota bacterium]
MARSTITAVALCIALALWIAPGLALDPQSTLAGDWRHPDCLGNHWLLVWMAERILSFESLLHNPLYYWPHGDAPWLAGNGSEGFLYLPFHLLFDWPASANAYVLSLLLGNGLAGYYLGRSAGAGPWASLVVAATTGCSVYVNLELSAGRFSQGDLLWLLTSIACFLKLLNTPSVRLAVITGILFALCAFFYFYYGLFLLLALVVIGAVHRVGKATLPWKEIVITGATAAVLIAPILVLFMSHWSSIPGTNEGFPHPMVSFDSIRPSLFLSPQGSPQQASQTVAAPILVLALLQTYRLAQRRSEAPLLEAGLLGVVVLFWWLALGPAGGLWTWLYGSAEPLKRFWWPYRHVVLIGPCLGILAARALRNTGRNQPLTAILVALSIPLSLSLQQSRSKMDTTPVRTPPPVYPELASRPEKVLLSVPFTAGATGSQAPLIYQFYHQKPMLNGHAPWVDRVRPEAWDQMVQSNTFLAQLASLEQGTSQNEVVFEAEDLSALIEDGLGLFVVDRELVPTDLWQMVQGYNEVFNALFGAPILSTNEVQVYSATNWNGQSTVAFKGFSWPSKVQRPSKNRLLGGLHPRSPMFNPR